MGRAPPLGLAVRATKQRFSRFMALEISEMRYRASGVRVLKVNRRGDRHELRDLTVDITFEGVFGDTDGDDDVIPVVESMRNAVYALARDHAGGEIEAFALALTHFFLAHHPAVDHVRVAISEQPWARIDNSGRPHDHAFARLGGERRVTRVTRTRANADPSVESGIEALVLLRTRPASISDYQKDRYANREETGQRLLAAELNALWRYGWAEVPHGVQWQQVRRVILDAFAEDDSPSIHQTLYAMARAALEQCPPLVQVQLRLPTRPPIAVDLTPFGMENTAEVFVPADNAVSVVEATIRRDELR
jgi:urate oxidase